jgi:uncharacterized membrane protein (UPF0127 family)
MFMKLIVNDNIFKVKLAVTPEAVKKGMMNQKFDESFNGMYFLMPRTENQCFWMKNCLENLDIIMVHNDVITEIHENCPPCSGDDCTNYCGYGDRVVELPGGTCSELGIKKGDKISFSLF